MPDKKCPAPVVKFAQGLLATQRYSGKLIERFEKAKKDPQTNTVTLDLSDSGITEKQFALLYQYLKDHDSFSTEEKLHALYVAQYAGLRDVDEELKMCVKCSEDGSVGFNRQGITELPPVLPEVGSSFKAVKVLALCGNLLTSLPEQFLSGKCYGYLRELDLSHNRLSNVTAACLNGCVSLRTLCLSHNELTALPNFGDGKFGLSQLAHLYLDHNKITKVTADNFKGLPALYRLGLSYNEITEFPDLTEITSRRLRYADLRNNKITQIGSTLKFAYEPLSGWNGDAVLSTCTRKVDLRGNPIDPLNRCAYAVPRCVNVIFQDSDERYDPDGCCIS